MIYKITMVAQSAATARQLKAENAQRFQRVPSTISFEAKKVSFLMTLLQKAKKSLKIFRESHFVVESKAITAVTDPYFGKNYDQITAELKKIGKVLDKDYKLGFDRKQAVLKEFDVEGVVKKITRFDDKLRTRHVTNFYPGLGFYKESLSLDPDVAQLTNMSPTRLLTPLITMKKV